MQTLQKCFEDQMPVLAPLAGITCRAFRETCRTYGCRLAIAPMISANGLKYPSSRSKTYSLFDWQDEPCAWVQLFGSDIEAIRDGVKILADSGACAIDINLGCSMAKVLKQGAGAALLKKPALALQILEAAASASPVPVTAKMRLGFSDCQGSLAIALNAHNAGICALTIHARTAVMGFSGTCLYETARQAVQAAKIPVIINGDICNAATAAEAMEKSGCQTFMIGRPAIGFPQIFARFANASANAPSQPSATSTHACAMPEQTDIAGTPAAAPEPAEPVQADTAIAPAAAAPVQTVPITASLAPVQSFSPTPAEVAEGFRRLAHFTGKYCRDEEQSVRELRRIFAMSAHYLPAPVQKSPVWHNLFQCRTFADLTKKLRDLSDCATENCPR